MKAMNMNAGTQSELLVLASRVRDEAVALLEGLYVCYPHLRPAPYDATKEWDEAEHPRDEKGRFAHGWLSAALGPRYHHPEQPLEGDASFWQGGDPGNTYHRDAITSQHFNGKFEVEIPPNERATIDHLSHLMFGRALQPREWGELIGAPDGENLEARALPRSVLVQIQPSPPGPRSPLFVSLMREVALGDAYGTEHSIAAHLVDSVINKQPDAPKALAPRMLAYSIRKCQELGIHTIVSHAEGNRHTPRTIGYWHWPLLGFDAALTPSDRSALGVISPRFRQANTVQALYAMEGGLDAWKRVGTGRKMFFDTVPQSRSQMVFAAYLKQKGIQP